MENLNEQLMHILFDGSCNYTIKSKNLSSLSLSLKKKNQYKLNKDYKNTKKEKNIEYSYMYLKKKILLNRKYLLHF